MPKPARSAAVRRALRAPARRLGRGRARRAPDPRHRDGVREVARASTCPCSTRSRASRRTARSTSIRRRRSRRTRRAHSPSCKAPNVRAAIYDGDTPGERRWQIRKWANVDPHEPRHAPRRRAAASRPLGRRPAQPALHRRRRGARLPRRLRLARRQRAPASAPARAVSTAPSPQFLLASATIANPGELAAGARGRRGDASSTATRRRAPSGRSLLWNPELLDAGARAARERARRCVDG